MTFVEFYRAVRRRIWSDNTILLLVRPAGKPLDRSAQKYGPGEIRTVTEKDLADCAAFEDAAVYAPIYRKMLKKGDVIHFGYLNGKCVYHHAAQCSGDVIFDGCLVRHLQPGEITTCMSYCAPEARGHGFQQKSLYQMFLTYFDFTSYTLVRPQNTPSLIAVFRVGYEAHSLLTVKNRFFHRRLTERLLSLEEAEAYIPQKT
ncbi:hypothetical protein AALA80_14740 [Oscillospiraceae bacterium 50-60]